jgi:hypothetical protein
VTPGDAALESSVEYSNFSVAPGAIVRPEDVRVYAQWPPLVCRLQPEPGNFCGSSQTFELEGMLKAITGSVQVVVESFLSSSVP